MRNLKNVGANGNEEEEDGKKSVKSKRGKINRAIWRKKKVSWFIAEWYIAECRYQRERPKQWVLMCFLKVFFDILTFIIGRMEFQIFTPW